MATPNCAKCGNSGFVMTRTQIVGARYIYWAIHCGSCGAVVSFVEHFNAASLLEKIMKHLGIPM